jgi:bloom syndrome protein
VDKQRVLNLPGPSVEVRTELLKSMTDYCIDIARCRRDILLTYFDEPFDSANCNRTCDNCILRGLQTVQTIDVTDAAASIVRIVNAIYTRRRPNASCITSDHVISVYLGEDSPKFRASGDSELEDFGAGANYQGRKGLLERIFPVLVRQQFLSVLSNAGGRSPFRYAPGRMSSCIPEKIIMPESVEEDLLAADVVSHPSESPQLQQSRPSKPRTPRF